jgi:hypothetical protein
VSTKLALVGRNKVPFSGLPESVLRLFLFFAKNPSSADVSPVKANRK